MSLARARQVARYVLAAERAPVALVSLEFCSNQDIARHHRRVMGVPGVTDIVSLEHDRSAPGAPVVGEVWIAPAVAADNARAAGIDVRVELARLVVHGVLHVLGHEHPEDVGRIHSPMWRRQEQHVRAVRRRGLV